MDANLRRAVCFVACTALVSAHALFFTVQHRFHCIVYAAKIRRLDLNHMAGLVVSEINDIFQCVAPFVGHQFDVYAAGIHFGCETRQVAHLSFAAIRIHRAFDAQVERLCSLNRFFEEDGHVSVIGGAEHHTDGAITVNMENGMIVLMGREFLHTIAQPFNVFDEFLALLAEFCYAVEQTMRKHLCALHDHLIGVGVTLIARLGENGQHAVVDFGAIFLGDHVTHIEFVGFCHCVKDCLGDAIANGRMQALSVKLHCVDLFGQALETVCLLTYKVFGDSFLNNGNEFFGQEQGIASAGAGILHRGAIAPADFAVFQNQHDRDSFACLTNAGKATGSGIAHVHVAIHHCALFDGFLIIKIETGAPLRTDNLRNFHIKNRLSFSKL